MWEPHLRVIREASTGPGTLEGLARSRRANWKQLTRAEDHQFGITSHLLPGLFRLELSGLHYLLGYPVFGDMDSFAQQEVVAAIDAHEDIPHYVIGPAIKPASTEDELRELVTKWVAYGFSFLQPLTAAGAGQGAGQQETGRGRAGCHRSGTAA
jgi:hypothetical protein